MQVWFIIAKYPISRSLFSECCACTTSICVRLQVSCLWDMAENLRCDGRAGPWQRRCEGNMAAVWRRRCGGNRLIPLAISALTRNAKGEEVKESIEAEGMMQRKRLLSLAKQFHLKKKSLSQLYCSMLFVVRLCIHPKAQCRPFWKRCY